VNSAVRRNETLDTAEFTYETNMRISDGVFGGYALRVAQVSDQFGPGLFAQLIVS